MHPDLTEQELEQKVDDAIMNDDDILADSSQMFAQQIIDDRYKREEAKIALMYAKEQKKELEQVFIFLILFINSFLINCFED